MLLSSTTSSCDMPRRSQVVVKLPRFCRQLMIHLWLCTLRFSSGSEKLGSPDSESAAASTLSMPDIQPHHCSAAADVQCLIQDLKSRHSCPCHGQ